MLTDRFWSHVDKNGPVPAHRPDLGSCWIWTGGQFDGYGVFHQYRGTSRAHRLAFLDVEEIPDGLVPDHLCLVKLCVRRSHMEAVTIGENVRRWAATVTHCPQRHEYTPENTFYAPRGRACRTCHRDRRRNNRANLRAQGLSSRGRPLKPGATHGQSAATAR